MTFKRVLRYDPSFKMLRLFRVVWDRGVVGDGRGFSSKLTVGLRPCLLGLERGLDSIALTLFGVRVHHKRSYGGRFV